jgi:hypothetical protein
MNSGNGIQFRSREEVEAFLAKLKTERTILEEEFNVSFFSQKFLFSKNRE